MNLDPHPAAAPREPRRADALPPGTVLEGCELVRVVADSGFAIVYLAREPGTERRYAIKEYLPVSLARRSADGRGVALRAPEHAEAFERGLLAFAAEAQLLEQRTHPALLRVLRSWQGQGTIYRQMPWLDGDTLLNLRRGLVEPPDEATLRRLLFGLLGALQTLHDAGEVHGAVSPGNIMLLSDDRPVLLDTDAVARALVGDQTRALMALISPGFAPRATEEGPAADLHALAAVAHFCITGALPAAGEPHEALAAGARTPRSRKPRAAFSAGLLDAIDNALSDDATRRPRNVAAFRASLAGQTEGPRAPEPAATAASSARTSDGPSLVAHAEPAEPATRPAPRPPASTGAYRRRRSAHGGRGSQRLVVWGIAGFMALLLVGGGSLLAWRERSTFVLPADAANPSSADLAPPAAQPLPMERNRRAAGTVATPEASPVNPTAVAPAAVRASAAVTARPASLAKPSPAPKPPKPPTPREVPAPSPAAVATSGSPRDECGARTEFSLYRCMRTECQQPRWQKHAQCQRLRDTDSVE